MAVRVRPAGPGDNVTDATLVQALGAAGATYLKQQEAADAAKTARAEHSNELKKWKGRGVNLKALKQAIVDRFLDPAEVLSDLHAYVRLRALQNMPSIQQDLVAMWTDIDLPDETREEIDRQRWRDDGAFCARNGQPREANPHTVGSEGFACWDMGWLNDQERIARAMGAAAPPVVDAGRARPVRKQASRKQAAETPAAPPAPVRRSRRRGAESVH